MCRVAAIMICASFLAAGAFAETEVGSGAVEPELRQPQITVTGTREERAKAFVSEVRPTGWASAQRVVPRWNTALCISVIGPPVEQGQAIADRMSQRAIDVGLEVGAPGCETNVLVVVSDRPDDLLPLIAEQHRGIFGFASDTSVDTGGSEPSLDKFKSSNRPIRWRQVVKTVAANGMPLDGNPRIGFRGLVDLPIVRNGEGSRLRSNVRREMSCVVMVVDTRQTAGIGVGAIADYLAFVTLADVSSDTDLGSFPSILNLFNPQAERLAKMSEWDEAFLGGLYSASLRSANGTMQYREIARRVAEYGQE